MGRWPFVLNIRGLSADLRTDGLWAKVTVPRLTGGETGIEFWCEATITTPSEHKDEFKRDGILTYTRQWIKRISRLVRPDAGQGHRVLDATRWFDGESLYLTK